MSDQLSFSERRKKLLAERAKAEGKPAPVKPVAPVRPEDVPDVDDRSDYDKDLDQAIKSFGVLEAYRKWIGKTVDEGTTKQREGVKVSCPQPNHPDKNPSAWLNLDKNTWFCGGCQIGGDVYDLAAIKFGIDDYKSGANFHKVREAIADDLGYVKKRVAGNITVLTGGPEVSADNSPVTPSERPDEPSEPSGQVLNESDDEVDSETAKVIQLVKEAEQEPDDDSIDYPAIDWRTIVSPDTFLYSYLEECTKDDSPEEYHFWHGLLAISHAIGRKVTLDDTRPVYGNLLLCLLGGTGVGKSRSRAHLDEVIHRALPFRDTGMTTEGVKVLPVPASGEYLISQFKHPIADPADPKKIIGNAPVNGIVDFDEFASLLARANRQGNTLKTIIMQFADTKNTVSTGSLAQGDTIAESPFCSFTASTQPRAVRTLLAKSDVGSGFLNRWVFAAGPRKRREVIGGARTGINVDLTTPVSQLGDIRSWSYAFDKIHWSDAAATRFEAFFYASIDPALQQDDDLLKRLDLLMKKLILLLTANERLREVPVYIVERVEQLFDYLLRCYGILGSNIGITQNQEIVEEIERHALRLQQKTGRGVSSRDLQLRMKRKNYSPKQIKEAIDVMVALDRLELDKTAGGPGRPTVRYKVVGA